MYFILLNHFNKSYHIDLYNNLHTAHDSKWRNWYMYRDSQINISLSNLLALPSLSLKCFSIFKLCFSMTMKINTIINDYIMISLLAEYLTPKAELVYNNNNLYYHSEHWTQCYGAQILVNYIILHQLFGSRVHPWNKMWTQTNLRFGEIEGSKRIKINEKGVNWIEKQRENWYKMIKMC